LKNPAEDIIDVSFILFGKTSKFEYTIHDNQMVLDFMHRIESAVKISEGTTL